LPKGGRGDSKNEESGEKKVIKEGMIKKVRNSGEVQDLSP